MAQQTAVEWLRHQLYDVYNKEGKLPLAYTLDLVKQAKQMEKKQIIDAWMAGDNDGSLEPKLMEGIAEEYYNDMYSQEDKTFKRKSQWTSVKKNPQHKNIGG